MQYKHIYNGSIISSYSYDQLSNEEKNHYLPLREESYTSSSSDDDDDTVINPLSGIDSSFFDFGSDSGSSDSSSSFDFGGGDGGGGGANGDW